MVTRVRSEPFRSDLSRRAKALRSRETPSEYRLPTEGLSGLLAHDLKTSLASISMNLDFAISELGASRSHAVAPALEDCKQANARVIRIVSDMADAARLTVGDYRPILAEVCPGHLVESSVRAATNEAAARDIRIVVSTDATRTLADADLLSRVVDRLLERALRQARAGTRLDVEQKRYSISIRASTGTGTGAELTAQSLTSYFARAAMAALGGDASVESPEADVLLYRLTLAG
jgi:K+-sensing histidine kinase KdpD